MSGFPERFNSAIILVVGDLILDEYVVGSAHRLSPEAPVPVVEVASRTDRPGGAANVAVNVASLGGKVTLLGVLGEDTEGARLTRSLDKWAGLDFQPVIAARRPTTTKTRVVANGAQVVRIDREVRGSFLKSVDAALVGAVCAAARDAEAIVVSDYLMGAVSDVLLAAVFTIAADRKIPCLVDPKRLDFTVYRGATVLTPNLAEARRAVGATLDVPTADLIPTLRDLVPETGLVITEGSDGMTVAPTGLDPIRIPARTRAVFDRTGAGDTVIACMALCLASDLSLVDAANLANTAASLVVGKPGAAALNPQELVETLRQKD